MAHRAVYVPVSVAADLVKGLDIRERGDGIRMNVRVKPRSSRSKLVGVREGALEIALRAPPVDGAANGELVQVLSKALGVPRSAVSIASGASGRNKRVDVDDIDRDAACCRISEGLA